MDVAYVSALSALGGSIVGGVISGATTWLSQRAQVRAGRLEHELSRREKLYKDFIIAASKPTATPWCAMTRKFRSSSTFTP
jgi:hypothetical protein